MFIMLATKSKPNFNSIKYFIRIWNNLTISRYTIFLRLYIKNKLKILFN